jgi:hypothetical protein
MTASHIATSTAVVIDVPVLAARAAIRWVLPAVHPDRRIPSIANVLITSDDVTHPDHVTGAPQSASGLTFVSTDRHRLHWATIVGLRSSGAADVVIPAAALKAAMDRDTWHVSFAADTFSTRGSSDSTTAAVSTTFPQFRTIVNREPVAGTADVLSMNALYLADLAKGWGPVGKGPKPTVRLFPTGPDKPILAAFPEVGFGIEQTEYVVRRSAVIMPVRTPVS